MLALGLAAVMAALIPREYVLIAVLGTFPFWVIGGVAAWRQLVTPSEEKRAHVLATVREQSWPEFSKTLHDAWRMQGIHATAGESESIDWRIAQEGKYTLVVAKRWKAAVHGLDPFRQLAKAMEEQGISKGLYIAAGGEISPPALRYAREHNISIWLGDELSLFLLGKQPSED